MTGGVQTPCSILTEPPRSFVEIFRIYVIVVGSWPGHLRRDFEGRVGISIAVKFLRREFDFYRRKKEITS
jgi:hypothetical protein